MCKIAAIIGIAPNIHKKLSKFVAHLAADIVDSQQDGFGYAAYSKKDGLFGERWVQVEDIFSRRNMMDEDAARLDREMMGTVKVSGEYNYFGKKFEGLYGVTSIIMHGRTSTNAISMENTHPFVMQDTALIHNGVISNHADIPKTLSTCDSEAILTRYLAADVVNDATQIEPAVTRLKGWFACAVLAKNKDGEWVVDMFKDNSTPLFFAVIKELGGAKVYATDEDNIFYACEKAKFKMPRVYRVSSNTLTRLDAVTGKVIEAVAFERSSYSMDDWDYIDGVYRKRDGGYSSHGGYGGYNEYGSGYDRPSQTTAAGPQPGVDMEVTAEERRAIEAEQNGRDFSDEEVERLVRESIERAEAREAKDAAKNE